MDPRLSPGGACFLMEVSPVGGILTLPPPALGRGRGEERLADCRPAPRSAPPPTPSSTEERISQTGYSRDLLIFSTSMLLLFYTVFFFVDTRFKKNPIFFKKKKAFFDEGFPSFPQCVRFLHSEGCLTARAGKCRPRGSCSWGPPGLVQAVPSPGKDRVKRTYVDSRPQPAELENGRVRVKNPELPASLRCLQSCEMRGACQSLSLPSMRKRREWSFQVQNGEKADG